jgi:stage IV sporulation protein FB
MGWSIGIGSIAGTAVRIHITFLLFLAWIFGANYIAGGAQAAWNGLIFMVLLFACVLAHEFGHILTARRFGVATPEVTLLPIGGVARLERIPEKPSEEFLIAIAGPLVNVAIVLALVATGAANLSVEHLSATESSKIAIGDRIAAANLFLAVFNLIPAFPMDGGRVLRALLAIRIGHVRATEVAATIGQAVAIALGFFGLFFNPILIFIGIFVYLAAASEAQLVVVRAMTRDVPVKSAMITQFSTLAPDTTIDAAIEVLLRTSQNDYPVVDGTGRPLGVLGRNDMIRALKTLGPQAKVGDAMTTPLHTVDARVCLDAPIRMLQEQSLPAVGVVGPEGALVGLVTPETIAEMIMVNNALPKDGSPSAWRLWARRASGAP